MRYIALSLFLLLSLNAQSLYESIIRYEQECFADSSEECFLVYVYDIDTSYASCTKFNMIDPGIDPTYRGTITKWIHREPAWDGFREFIKRKNID